MRTVARYSMTAIVPEERDQLQDYLNLLDRVQQWLAAKGQQLSEDTGIATVRYKDGREAQVRRVEIDLGVSGLREVVITEPTTQGLFETGLTIGITDRSIAVFAHLRVGGRDEPIGPIRFDASCPRLLRDFLTYELPWTYGGCLLPKEVVRLRTDADGADFAHRLQDPGRCLPIVTISEYQGFLLHPNIAEMAATDLACLAEVVVVDERAAWRMTKTLGSQWSCYNGSIRIYWPNLKLNGDPRYHPLWTGRRLIDTYGDTAVASQRVRGLIKRRIMEMSAFTVREPQMFEQIRSEERHRRFEAQRLQDSSVNDYAQLAESYAQEASELRALLDERDREIEDLRSQVSSLNIALRWKDGAIDELEPERVTPPATMPEAVDRARVEYADALIFGADVDEAITFVAQDAGPPDKILMYLCRLAELSRARKEGPLGTSMIDWLYQRGVAASPESEMVTTSAAERGRRIWSDGKTKRFFSNHLKPVDAVSPDRCVRIYFDWDDESQKIVVAYIGRHP